MLGLFTVRLIIGRLLLWLPLRRYWCDKYLTRGVPMLPETTFRLASSSGVLAAGFSGGQLFGLLGGVSSAGTALGMLALAISSNNRAKRKELRDEMQRAYRRGVRDQRLGVARDEDDEMSDDDAN